MTLLGIDVGTTHCKASLFAEDGTLLALASRPMITQRTAGYAGYEPETLWQTVIALIQEASQAAGRPAIAAVGVASMAETGLLLDRDNGRPRSLLIPWFDTGAAPQAEWLKQAEEPAAAFRRSGIYPSFKCSLAKLLWLRQQEPAITENGVWLSAADYLAYRLTGVMATDYSLAGRTYAFDLTSQAWDEAWLARFGLEPACFAPAQPAGTPLAQGVRPAASQPGLAAGTTVVIAGHDHVCASLAVGVTGPGPVFDSMGTAEVLLGALPAQPIDQDKFQAGFSLGCHVARDRLYWMGGLSTSGGSIEWLRSLLGRPPLSYEALATLLADVQNEPGSLLFFPYLAGSGAPHTDPAVRGAFVGLSAAHGPADLLQAVLEGTAYELEFIRRAAEKMTGTNIERIIAAGGGTQNRRWLQIKADVSGCRLEIPAVPEATLLGAALLAGIGRGLYANEAEAIAATRRPPLATIEPDNGRHAAYQQRYREGYLALQEPLRGYQS
jgi:sugar (pentulose or hexulose) kinase